MIDRHLGGRYHIQARVGEGGMAIVYQATDTLLDRRVAVKVLRSEFTGDEDFVRRFRHEARAAARLSHPNIVQIYDVGDDDGVHYIVMEWVRGRTLQEKINEEAPLSPAVAINITRQVLEALQHAHEHHVIHRDIKPQNILITPGGQIKVTDFGIARAVGTGTLAETQSVMGSAHYMSPEQAKGRFTGTQSDLYSVGVMLFEMLTGRRPYDGDTLVTVAMQHLQAPVPRLSEFRDDLPPALQLILDKALAKETSERYRRAELMIHDLLHYRTEELERLYAAGDGQATDQTIILPAAQLNGKSAPAVAGEAGDVEDEDVAHAASAREGSAPAGSALPERVTGPVPRVRGGAGFAREATSVNGREPFSDGVDDATPGATDHDTDHAIADPGSKARARRRPEWLKPWVVVTAIAVIVFGVLGAVVAKALLSWLNPPLIEVPDVVGIDVETAAQRLAEHGISLHVLGEVTSDRPAGEIIAQSPQPGDTVRQGAAVDVTVSSGPAWVEGGVPDVRGDPIRQARIDLQQAGLDVAEREEHHDQVPEGHVIDQNPPPSTPITVGETVELVVSLGPERTPIVMPQLIGMPLPEARALLESLGLVLAGVEAQPSDYPLETVFAQQPQAGASLFPGDEVHLKVSQGAGETPQQTPITIQLQPEPRAQAIEVWVRDRSERLVHAGDYAGGQVIQTVVPWYGRRAEVIVYVNGQPLTTLTLPATQETDDEEGGVDDAAGDEDETGNDGDGNDGDGNDGDEEGDG